MAAEHDPATDLDAAAEKLAAAAAKLSAAADLRPNADLDEAFGLRVGEAVARAVTTPAPGASAMVRDSRRPDTAAAVAGPGLGAALARDTGLADGDRPARMKEGVRRPVEVESDKDYAAPRRRRTASENRAEGEERTDGFRRGETAKQLAGPEGGWATAAETAQLLGRQPGLIGTAARVAGPLLGHLAGPGDKNKSGGSGMGGALLTAAGFIPGPIGAAARLGGMLGGLFGGGGGSSGGEGGGGGAGGGGSGIGETAKKIAGMVPVVGEVIGGLQKFARAVVDGAMAQHNLNMQYADASAAMAGVLAETEMRDWQRDREIGDKTAATAADLAEATSNYKDSVGKIETLFSNVKNEVFAGLLNMLNGLLEPIADLLGEINDLLFEETKGEDAAKWLDRVKDNAQARRQAGDEWFDVRRK